METLPSRMRGTKLVTAMQAVRRDTNPAWPIDVWPCEQVRELPFVPPGLPIVRDRHFGPKVEDSPALMEVRTGDLHRRASPCPAGQRPRGYQGSRCSTG